jgi:hypothetical protein
MVWLHMMRNEIGGLSTCKSFLEVCLPLVSLPAVSSIHNGYLLVLDEVGVIAHAFRHNVLALKKVNIKVVNANKLN